jgi:hypothetical protein
MMMMMMVVMVVMMVVMMRAMHDNEYTVRHNSRRFKNPPQVNIDDDKMIMMRIMMVNIN